MTKPLLGVAAVGLIVRYLFPGERIRRHSSGHHGDGRDPGGVAARGDTQGEGAYARVGVSGNDDACRSAAVWLAGRGARIVDFDALVRETFTPGSAVMEEVTTAGGLHTLTAAGELDLSAVGLATDSAPPADVGVQQTVFSIMAGQLAAIEEQAPAASVVVYLHPPGPGYADLVAPDLLIDLAAEPEDVWHQRVELLWRGLAV
jgi:hypothetical protein